MRKLSSVGLRHPSTSLRCQSIWSFCPPLPSKELRSTDIFSVAWVYNQLCKFYLKNSLPLSEKDLFVILLKFQPVYSTKYGDSSHLGGPAIPAPGLQETLLLVFSTSHLPPCGQHFQRAALALLCLLSCPTPIPTAFSWMGKFLFRSLLSVYYFPSSHSIFHQVAILL